jgi:hypothetical protein
MNYLIRATALLGLIAASVFVSPNLASANSDRITAGDAHATFQSLGNGGGGILGHGGGVVEGAPVTNDVAIRPYFDDGIHYCVEDWHVIVLAWFDAHPNIQSAKADFDPFVWTFTLDGAALPTTRNAVKRFLQTEYLGPDIQEAYYFQQGRIMSPSDLTVGSHILTMTQVHPGHPGDPNYNDFYESQFFIDAVGTGACL